MDKQLKTNSIRWHVTFKFGWSQGHKFSAIGLHRKLVGRGMADGVYSTAKYMKVSEGTVRRAIDMMLENGDIKIVEKKYNCYDRVLYELITVYPF